MACGYLPSADSTSTGWRSAHCHDPFRMAGTEPLEERSIARWKAPRRAYPSGLCGPEIFRFDDEVSHEHRTADTVEMPLAGSIFCQADVASVKNFFGAAAAAHLDLQLAGRDDSDLIDDTRMKIHPPVFPA